MDNPERVVCLVASLTGPAANLLIGMTMGQLDDYTFLVVRLSRRYDPPGSRGSAPRRVARTHQTPQRETNRSLYIDPYNSSQGFYSSQFILSRVNSLEHRVGGSPVYCMYIYMCVYVSVCVCDPYNSSQGFYSSQFILSRVNSLEHRVGGSPVYCMYIYMCVYVSVCVCV